MMRQRSRRKSWMPRDYGEDLNGKVVAVKPASLGREFRTVNNQLVIITGGSGSRAHPRGNTCFCTYLHSGENGRWRRTDIMGVVKPERLPAWAKEDLEKFQREQAEKKKVAREER